MKYIFTLLMLFLTDIAFAQSDFPDFLQGTWKMENKESYEHWDKLNENTLKGFTYKIKDGQLRVSEYLDISRNKNQIIYTATVLNQNQAKGIEFELTKIDSTFTFENPKHDFPKKIVYQKRNESEIFVQVSDGKNGFSFKMKKQDGQAMERDSSIANPNYDASLANKLGADDYGMKSYIFVVLKTGSNKTTDKELISEAFKGHMSNINRLVEKRKLIVAGPFGTNDNGYRGIFIFDNVASIEEAKELLQTDPAVKAELLDFELYNWYGSAALPEYLKFSDKIWKLNP
ncbi:DUF6265 family protein [Pricia sp. S334]|uniref:DUF6265 family protein n=1 Tax=Pricia mediterranea TaxID=3076079 RepID=A0ABU3L2S3_9FLAO|nr:DUF6265 family protein [Pricia sp. S334]MDT7827698.1 DUF6265 family protein [Pricia sp. S334]